MPATCRHGRRTAVWVAVDRGPELDRATSIADHPSLVRPEAADEGDAFARNRARHALELVGACVMILAFLAMAMFV